LMLKNSPVCCADKRGFQKRHCFGWKKLLERHRTEAAATRRWRFTTKDVPLEPFPWSHLKAVWCAAAAASQTRHPASQPANQPTAEQHVASLSLTVSEKKSTSCQFNCSANLLHEQVWHSHHRLWTESISHGSATCTSILLTQVETLCQLGSPLAKNRWIQTTIPLFHHISISSCSTLASLHTIHQIMVHLIAWLDVNGIKTRNEVDDGWTTKESTLVAKKEGMHFFDKIGSPTPCPSRDFHVHRSRIWVHLSLRKIFSVDLVLCHTRDQV